MARGISLSGVIALACITLGARGGESNPAKVGGFSTFASAPLCFEANAGQLESAAPFIARGAECSVLIAPTEAEIVLGKSSDRIMAFGQQATRSVRLQLVGGNPAAKMAGRDQMAATANYFIGNDPSEWHAGVPLFSRVRVDEVYPGVQVIYYANQSAQLEYDFVLQPGARPDQIRFHIEGPNSIRVDVAGNLVLKIGDDEISQHKPVVYQKIGGVRTEIQAGYHMNKDGTVGFALAEYDRTSPLIIDPSLDFLTYVGGKKLDIGWGIAFDGTDIFVVGETLSIDLPTTNVIVFTNTLGNVTNFAKFQGGTHGFGDAFVSSYDTNGALRFLTYLGGKRDDGALAVAADGGGGVWFTGFTDSTNFPLKNPAQTNLTGENRNALRLFAADAFIAHLDSTGSNLDYSTYFGGGALDEGTGIAVVNGNEVYITGLTVSTNFPFNPANAYQTNTGGASDVFVAKFINGTNVYATYLGGTNTEYGEGIAVDSAGDAWVTGFTYSTNSPTTNWLQLSNVFQMQGVNMSQSNHLFADLNSQTNSRKHDTSFRSDAFVSEISPDGTALLFSTYLGGTNDDVGLSITVDPVTKNNVYVTGYTFSPDFPTNVVTFPVNTNLITFVEPNSNVVFTNAPTNFVSHVFVTEITNQVIAYSTQFGGRSADAGTGIAVDNNGLAYVIGSRVRPTFSRRTCWCSPIRLWDQPINISSRIPFTWAL